MDFAASWSFSDHCGVLLKYTRFDNRGYIGDITKAGAQLTAVLQQSTQKTSRKNFDLRPMFN